VRFLNYAAAPIMPALSTRASGEVVEVPRNEIAGRDSPPGDAVIGK